MGLTAAETIALDRERVYPTYDRLPIVLVGGSGLEVYDLDGRRYLDFLSGIGVNALGHGHPRVMAALTRQAGRLMHASNLFHNEHQAGCAEDICRVTGMERVFFCNSGAEAIETALKLARHRAWRLSGGTGRNGLVALNGSFHGRTLGSLSITGKESIRRQFGPLIPGVTFVEPGDVEGLRAAVTDETCAVVIEPILGEGGVRALDPSFLAAAREACDQHDALLVFDEIQCGLGRTGHWLASHAAGVRADLVALAKPLGLGLPMGALAGTAATALDLPAGAHGSTFGGGPLACALSREFIRTIEEEGLIDHIRAVGARLAAHLSEIAGRNPLVREVRGAGLMAGLELAIPGRQVVAGMLQRGFIINCTRDTVLRFLPPYIVAADQIDGMADALWQALADPALPHP